MLKFDVKFNGKFPTFDFQEDLREVADKIIIRIIKQNINNQVSLDEGILKPNDPTYTEYKRRKGLSEKILIAKGDLVASLISKDKGKKTVVVTFEAERLKIAGYLQDMGKNFFGVSARMKKSTTIYMKKRIKEILDAGRK